GAEYAEEQLARIRVIQEGGTILCPRCGVNRYTPYGGERPTQESPFPALSRLDNQTYICSSCGTDEAMRDYEGQPPIPPNEWPIVRDGSFGQGRWLG
ncbi:MAG TPA: hypothetical protein VEP28_08930, partial [Rubrobacter sp.]|nr:hypothetical protein [Rubrobacter sp.]